MADAHPTKTCRLCHIDKPTSEFRPANRDKGYTGLRTECRKCGAAEVRRYRQKNLASRREKDRERYYQNRGYYRDIERKRTPEKMRAKRELRGRQKANANAAIYRAISRGKMQRPTVCEDCGFIGKVHAHHEDYSKPMDVVWVCVPCHGIRHRKQDERTQP